MDKIIIDSIRIIDFNENKSVNINFLDGINIVTSEHTSRGKSSILRAIYHAMGANSSYDPSFKVQSKTFDIKFRNNEFHYRIIRNKNKYFCYKNGNLVLVSNNNYKTLAKFFEKELDVSIYLTDRNGNFDIAPPTYLFIPYFADQDMSWKSMEAIPFSNNKQFKDDSLINLYYFHMGILNKTYYTYNSKKIACENELRQLETEKTELQNQIFKLKEYFKNNIVSIDEDSAQANLDFLKHEINKYLKAENDIKTLIFNSENNIAKYNIQINKIKEILKEFNKIKPDVIECPNCGWQIEEQKDKMLYQTELLKQKLEIIELDLKNENKNCYDKKQEYSNIVKQIELLNKKYTNDNNLFETYLKNQTSKILIGDLEKDYTNISNDIDRYEIQTKEINDILKLYDEKKAGVNKEFKTTYLTNLKELGIENIDPKYLKKFEIYKKSGSQLVRSTLAYFLTIIDLKNKHNKDKFNFPLVVDSPLEGEQDEIDKEGIISKILSFYKDNNMNNQVIIALRKGREVFKDTDKINFIELFTEKEHLLTTENYKKDQEIPFIKNLIDE